MCYSNRVCVEQHMEQLISLILKVAKEQGYCFPGNKVMIFTVENEGKQNETAAFRMIDIDEEWKTPQSWKSGNPTNRPLALTMRFDHTDWLSLADAPMPADLR